MTWAITYVSHHSDGGYVVEVQSDDGERLEYAHVISQYKRDSGAYVLTRFGIDCDCAEVAAWLASDPEGHSDRIDDLLHENAVIGLRRKVASNA